MQAEGSRPLSESASTTAVQPFSEFEYKTFIIESILRDLIIQLQELRSLSTKECAFIVSKSLEVKLTKSIETLSNL